MEMLEILKTRLPDGLEIVSAKQRGATIHLVFAYKGEEVKSTLQTSCAPGAAEKLCDFTVCLAMAQFAMNRGDVAEARAWMDKQQAVLTPAE